MIFHIGRSLCICIAATLVTSIRCGDMALTAAGLFEVTLVVIFGPVKLGGGNNHGRDWFGELAGLFEVGFGFAGDLFLRGIGEEDCASVLGADVRALPVERGGVVVVPEDVKELGVSDLFGVVSDADRFGVAGPVGADIPVGWVFGCATGITNFRDDDTFGLSESFFNAPEATGGKDGGCGGGKFQGDRIEAITAAGGFGAVVEDVTEVSITARAKDFGTFHAVTVIDGFGDVVGINRFQKTRPAGAGVEFGSGTEQRQAATDAGINTGLVVVVKCPTERRLGAFAAGDSVLFRCEELAPFGVGFGDFLHSIGGSQGQQTDRNQKGMFHVRKMA